MAKELGAESLELVRRGYHSGRRATSAAARADNTSNYAQESRALLHNDPRSSHASVWMYLERIPLVVHAPGLVEPSGLAGARDARRPRPNDGGADRASTASTHRDGTPAPRVARTGDAAEGRRHVRGRRGRMERAAALAATPGRSSSA